MEADWLNEVNLSEITKMIWGELAIIQGLIIIGYVSHCLPIYIFCLVYFRIYIFLQISEAVFFLGRPATWTDSAHSLSLLIAVLPPSLLSLSSKISRWNISEKCFKMGPGENYKLRKTLFRIFQLLSKSSKWIRHSLIGNILQSGGHVDLYNLPGKHFKTMYQEVYCMCTFWPDNSNFGNFS